MSDDSEHSLTEFPLPPPGSSAPEEGSISKIYQSVHKRIASIASTAASILPSHDGAPRSTEPCDSSSDGPLKSKTAIPLDLQQTLTKHIKARAGDDAANVPLCKANAVGLPSEKRGEQSFEPRNASGLLFRVAQKASASTQSVFAHPVVSMMEGSSGASTILKETRFACTDHVQDSDCEPISPSGSSRPATIYSTNCLNDHETESAAQNEIGLLQGELPFGPPIQRRPSLSRQESISTVLRRLRSGTLGREFWMKDETCQACFLCDASFSSKS